MIAQGFAPTAGPFPIALLDTGNQPKVPQPGSIAPLKPCRLRVFLYETLRAFVLSCSPKFAPKGNTMKVATFALLAMFVLSPAVSLFPEPAQRDVPAEVENARRALQNANNELQHAGGQWGGHRVAAMHHIEQALGELNQAEKWAREHHDMK